MSATPLAPLFISFSRSPSFLAFPLLVFGRFLHSAFYHYKRSNAYGQLIVRDLSALPVECTPPPANRAPWPTGLVGWLVGLLARPPCLPPCLSVCPFSRLSTSRRSIYLQSDGSKRWCSSLMSGIADIIYFFAFFSVYIDRQIAR